MNTNGLVLVVLMGIASFSTVDAGGEPPKVVKATPDNGDSGVDPGLREIRIVFDQAMSSGGHSIVGGGEKFPKLTGRPRWPDEKTMVIPVQLEPNKEYWLSINSDRFSNTRSKAGEPAVPYPITFKTGAPKPMPERNEAAVARLRDVIDKQYSYRDRLKLDWDKLFADATPKLKAAKTPAEFAQEAGKMLEPAKDIHMTLMVDKQYFGTARRAVPPNANPRILPQVVSGLVQPNRTVMTGKLEGGITYVAIHNWDPANAEHLEAAFDAIKAADPSKGLVLDVRLNAGGDETLARQIAGCFVSEPKVYSKSEIREDGRFHGPFDRVVEPSKGRPAYRGKVAVLMGRYCMSSTESFLLMMKQAGATLVGQRSYGSSGNPRPHELGNGVTILVPSWRDLRPDGTCIEGEGVAPDLEVKATPADGMNADPVIAAAVKTLRETPAK